jgi:hypothetical protein
MKINKTWILSLAKKYDNENPHDKQKEESIMKLTVQMARDKKGISIALLKKWLIGKRLGLKDILVKMTLTMLRKLRVYPLLQIMKS